MILILLQGLLLTPAGLSAGVDVEELLNKLVTNSGCQPLAQKLHQNLQDIADVRPREAVILQEYGFQSYNEQKISCHNNKLVLQIYQMLDSVAAYGIFTLYRTSESTPLHGFKTTAAESQESIVFAQDHFFVKIRRNTSPSTRPVAIKIAQFLSQALPENFLFPSIVHYLPQQHLVMGSEKFVMGHQALNFIYPLGERDLFGLAHGAEAVLADYQLPNHSAKLLLVMYPTQQLAKKYLEIAYQQYTAQHPDQQIFYKREGPLSVIVLDSSDPEIATSFLDKISYTSSVTWDPKVEPISVGIMMVNVFIYVGTIVGITLGVGLSFGLLRILLSRLFPGKIFDRQNTYQVISLNLKTFYEKPSLPVKTEKTSGT